MKAIYKTATILVKLMDKLTKIDIEEDHILAGSMIICFSSSFFVLLYGSLFLQAFSVVFKKYILNHIIDILTTFFVVMAFLK